MTDIQVGLRVIRGPDWRWGDEDGGEGSIGTVTSLQPKSENGSVQEGRVSVLWDHAERPAIYRVGSDNAYDLRVYDSGPVGVKHTDFSCDACLPRKREITGTRYACVECDSYDLCSVCYNNLAHDPSHAFYRIDMPDAPKVLLLSRKVSHRMVVKGFFVGAKVVRGLNWEWNVQDGGPGKSGRIVSIEDRNDSFRSTAKVVWSIGKENVYRIGMRGKVDLRCVSPGTSFCFRDHLQVLGKPVTNVNSSQMFKKGDRVIMSVDGKELEMIQRQQGRGGWNPQMLKFIGKPCTVHRVTEQGCVRVRFDDCDYKWTIDPRALSKIDDSFSVGDYVRFIPNEESVKENLKGHGEWTESMAADLGTVGVVIKVYDDKDLRVSFQNNTWTLSPKCLELVKGNPQSVQSDVKPESKAFPSNISVDNAVHLTRNGCNGVPYNSNLNHHSDPPLERLTISEQVSIPNNAYDPAICTPLVLEVMKQVVENNPLAIDEFITTHPHALDCPGRGGRTILHIAAHEGYVKQLENLLAHNACIYYPDDAGDTALHYAVFGNKPEAINTLIKGGANIDITNKSGHTALHVAVNRGFATCVLTLLEHGCNVNVQDRNMDSPVHDAVATNFEGIQLLLINHPGVDFKLENNRGFNILHQAVLRGHRPVVEEILARDALLANIPKSCDGFTPLHIACCNGHLDIVRLLVEGHNCPIDCTEFKNKTPIMPAIAYAHYAVVEYLIEKNAKINVQDVDGNSVLHILCMKRTSYKTLIEKDRAPQLYKEYLDLGGPANENGLFLTMFIFLVKHGASLSIVNNRNQKPLDLIATESLRNEVLRHSQPFLVGKQQEGVTEDEQSLEALQSKIISSKPVPVECTVCSELGVANVLLKPCNHSVACEDCSSRMKKCIICKTPIESRVTTDGRTIPSIERCEKSKIERVNYLESKISEIEEMNMCTICMERCRNTIFLCGHGTCEVCARTLKYCHMCRKKIEQRINVFL